MSLFSDHEWNSRKGCAVCVSQSHGTVYISILQHKQFLKYQFLFFMVNPSRSSFLTHSCLLFLYAVLHFFELHELGFGLNAKTRSPLVLWVEMPRVKVEAYCCDADHECLTPCLLFIWQELQLFCFILYEAELLVMFQLQVMLVYSVACSCEPSASMP